MTFLYFAGPQYYTRAEVLMTSIKTYHPYDQIEYVKLTDDFPVGTYIPGFHKLKYKKILELFDKGHEEVIYIGSDCEIFSPLYEVQNIFQYREADVIITPHMKTYEGFSRDTLLMTYKTGMANSDFIAFRSCENSRNTLKWLIEMSEDNTRDGSFFDQTWVSSLPFLFPNVYILRDYRYQIAYWDVEEYNKINSVLDKENPMRFYHYSGFEKGQLPRISKHSDRIASGDVLELLKRYDERI